MAKMEQLGFRARALNAMGDLVYEIKVPLISQKGLVYAVNAESRNISIGFESGDDAFGNGGGSRGSKMGGPGGGRHRAMGDSGGRKILSEPFELWLNVQLAEASSDSR